MFQRILWIALLCAGTLRAEVPAASPQTLTRSLQNLSYTVNNHEQEIGNLRQRIQNQEVTLESMHSEVSSLIKAAKETQKQTGTQVDTRLKGMEKNLDKLVADLKQFKKHANESTSSFSDLQKKLQQQDEIIALQSQQIKDLETALRSIANAMQVKVSGGDAKDAPGTYRVKSGDTLEKIAKDHATTIDAIKKENNLQKDTIYTGQKLQIP